VCNAEMTDYDVLLSRKSTAARSRRAAGPLRPVSYYMSLHRPRAEAGRILSRLDTRSQPSDLEDDFKQAIG
jgi:hypothetical protein